MKTNKLTATTEYGTFSRSTNRAYQFVVASRGYDEGFLAKRRENFKAHARKEYGRYADIAAGRVPNTSGLKDEWYKEQAAKLEAVLADLDTRFDLNVAEGRKQLETGKGMIHGWSTRRDLAEKLAGSVRNEGRYLNVKIFPVD